MTLRRGVFGYLVPKALGLSLETEFNNSTSSANGHLVPCDNISINGYPISIIFSS